MYDKSTLAAVLLNTECDILRGKGITDPASACKAVAWLQALVNKDASITIDGVMLAFLSESDPNKNAWAFGVILDQHDLLYPEFLATMIDALSVSQSKVLFGRKTLRCKLKNISVDAIKRKFQLSRSVAALEKMNG